MKKNHYETLVRLQSQISEDTLEDGEIFNHCYTYCCAWVQAKCPVTNEKVEVLSASLLWNKDDLYWHSVEQVGTPNGGWFRESINKLPLHNGTGIYSLYLAGKHGVAVAILHKFIFRFPPRKETCTHECYIFYPEYGIIKITSHEINDLTRKVKEGIKTIFLNSMPQKIKDIDEKLCCADITKHVMFTIKANGGSKSTNFQ